MAIKKRLGTLLGPEGRAPQLSAGQTDQVGPDVPASASIVKVGTAQYRVQFAIPQGDRGLPGVNAVPADEAVAAYVSDEMTDTRHALDEVVASRTKFSLAAGPASGVSVSTDSTRPYAIGRFGGYLWGNLSGRVWRSSNGEAWSDFCASPDGSPVQIIRPVDGGEVIAATYGGVFKSSGWSTESVTWTRRLTPTRTANFQPFSLSATGSKAIAAEYGTRQDSRYAWISLDAGETWEVAYDALERYTTEQYNYTHIHGVEYDPWSDRFYLAEGHGDIAGIYVSTDDGQTWLRPPGLQENPSPTTLTATDDGLVCGSDSTNAGLFGIIRQDDPMDEEFIETWRWRPGIGGVLGFGVSGYRDPDTGVVYVAFRSAMSTVAPVVAGGTAGAAGLVYQWPSTPVGAQDDIKHAIVVNGRLYAHGRINDSQRHLIGNVAAPGIPRLEQVARVEGDSLFVGPGASGSAGVVETTALGLNSFGAFRAVAVGHGSRAQESAIAIGQGTESGPSSIALGRDATNGTSGHSHAIGTNATVRGGQAVALGSNTDSSAYAVTVGDGAEALTAGIAVGQGSNTAAYGTSVGRSATVEVDGGEAIGNTARSAHYRGTAIGNATETTAAYQTHIGARMLAAQPISPPAAPPTGHGYLYFQVVNGKMGLYAQFPSGGRQGPIAEEP